MIVLTTNLEFFQKVIDGIIRTVLAVNLFLRDCSVGECAYCKAVIDGNTCNRIKTDKRTAVLSSMVVGALHQRTLRKYVAHFHIYSNRSI